MSNEQQQQQQQQQQKHKKTPKFLLNSTTVRKSTTNYNSSNYNSADDENTNNEDGIDSIFIDSNNNKNINNINGASGFNNNNNNNNNNYQQLPQHITVNNLNVPNSSKMNDTTMTTILKPSIQHRPSVRSISEFPNVIGAHCNEYENDLCTKVLTVISWGLVVAFFPLSLLFTFRIVQEYERAVIFRLGRLKSSSKGPGMIFFLPCIESSTKVDMRTVSFDVAPQEVLTKDSVTVSVDAVVYYRVFNPAVSVANVENAQESTRLLAQTSLRNVLGQKSLSEILSDRESVSRAMRECLDEATDPWGIEVERVEFKDVRLPVQLQRAMATEAEAAREARAKVIAAEGEQRAAKALKGAADIINQSPCALQLRYLQTLNNIAAEKNSTIIFPIPIELLRAIPQISNNYNNNNNNNSQTSNSNSII